MAASDRRAILISGPLDHVYPRWVHDVVGGVFIQMYTRAVLIQAAFAAVLSAQFSELATDGPGTRVLFSSSRSLIGETRQEWPKLFEASPSGVRTLAAIEPDPGQGSPFSFNFYMLHAPEFSADGRTLAWTGEARCYGGSGCITRERFQGTIQREGRPDMSRTGKVRLSANGRWAFFTGGTSILYPPHAAIVDLESGREIPVDADTFYSAGTGRRVVANNGTVVSAGAFGGIFLTDAHGVRRAFSTNANARAVTIADSAQYALYETDSPSPSIVLLDAITGEQIVAVAAVEGCRAPSLAQDSRTMLFLSAANWEGKNDQQAVQAWLMDLYTGTLRQASSENDDVVEATISGDARVVYAATSGGRVLRIDLASGETSEAVPTTPSVSTWTADEAPGSSYTILGHGLANAEASLNGIQLKLTGGEPGAADYLLPWSMPVGDGYLEVGSGGSPFQPEQKQVHVATLAPSFLRWGEFWDVDASEAVYIWALHDGPWRLVTAEDPARPGEVIQLQMRGLGPVDSKGAVVSPLRWQVQIGYNGIPIPLEVLDARMWPGQEGIYLVTIRMPAAFEAAPVMLMCNDPAGSQTGDNGPIPAQP
jgi:uncharacterized protein (TIGR03437 family)